MISEPALGFLSALLDTPGPSGFEAELLAGFARRIRPDADFISR